jgi:hypothetical protein
LFDQEKLPMQPNSLQNVREPMQIRLGSDEEQRRFAVAQSRAIFTQEKDLLKVAGRGAEHHAILLPALADGRRQEVADSETNLAIG